MGGTKKRMKDFAEYIANVLQLPNEGLVNITKNSHRYAMYKIGPVLSVNVSIILCYIICDLIYFPLTKVRYYWYDTITILIIQDVFYAHIYILHTHTRANTQAQNVVVNRSNNSSF